ncbi:hypothetical protein BESB_007600 [Besnoitia besnoiti]|uniref:Uncharacterized protein n=1 Tax=Besnoitia besnoiti TaxID=94643 RepID=A0A2A9MIQ4_BESBE|nr:hypothetical protein BESB_007600 [Besnoitia besnoiti]PFH38418.1 hypothetical protein BESB_007600 [Besnoitia besnoiti]
MADKSATVPPLLAGLRASRSSLFFSQGGCGPSSVLRCGVALQAPRPWLCVACFTIAFIPFLEGPVLPFTPGECVGLNRKNSPTYLRSSPTLVPDGAGDGVVRRATVRGEEAHLEAFPDPAEQAVGSPAFVELSAEAKKGDSDDEDEEGGSSGDEDGANSQGSKEAEEEPSGGGGDEGSEEGKEGSEGANDGEASAKAEEQKEKEGGADASEKDEEGSAKAEHDEAEKSEQSDDHDKSEHVSHSAKSGEHDDAETKPSHEETEAKQSGSATHLHAAGGGGGGGEKEEPEPGKYGGKYKVQLNFKPELIIPSDLRGKTGQGKVHVDDREWFQVESTEPTKILKLEGANAEDTFFHEVRVA